ncbi:MAG: carboxypeptidase-like regulatory domain-containing protein [Chitinophagales bacterium]
MRKLLLSILFFPFFLHAQNGIIQGRIYDEINNEAIIGANITVKGTDFGASSDVDGNYIIEGLTAGLYNIEVSYLGYETQTLFEVQVSNVKPVRLDIALRQTAQELDSIVVKANPFEKKMESPLSLTSIGVNEIQRNPGGNRDTSAIKNLPGVAASLYASRNHFKIVRAAVLMAGEIEAILD